MKSYDNFDVEAELKPLINNYYSSIKHINRAEWGFSDKMFYDLEDNNVIYYANKQQKALHEILFSIINPFIKRLLDYQEYENFFSDKYYECKPFAFVFKKEDIGYVVVYDSLSIEANQLLTKTKCSKIICVSTKRLRKTYIKRGEEQDEITLQSFFVSCLGFSDEKYEVLVKNIEDVYKKANNLLGFSVRKKISDFSINDYKEIALKKLEDDFLSGKGIVYYKALDEVKKFSYEDIKYVASRFSEYYRCLCSDEQYAMCFVTAEYMFDLFNSDTGIDQTSAVLGYIKALEQLFKRIFTLLNIPLETEGNCEPTLGTFDKAIRKNIIRIGYNFPIIRSTHNRKGRSWDIEGRKIVFGLPEMVNDFLKNCRNKYVHAVNIPDRDTAAKIRNNARVIIFLTIGGLFNCVSKDEVKEILGVKTNYEFENFYNFITKLNPNEEFVELELPTEKYRVVAKLEQEPTEKEIILKNVITEREYVINNSFIPTYYDYVVDKKRFNYNHKDVFEENDTINFFDGFKPTLQSNDCYRVDVDFHFCGCLGESRPQFEPTDWDDVPKEIFQFDNYISRDEYDSYDDPSCNDEDTFDYFQDESIYKDKKWIDEAKKYSFYCRNTEELKDTIAYIKEKRLNQFLWFLWKKYDIKQEGRATVNNEIENQSHYHLPVSLPDGYGDVFGCIDIEHFKEGKGLYEEN